MPSMPLLCAKDSGRLELRKWLGLKEERDVKTLGRGSVVTLGVFHPQVPPGQANPSTRLKSGVPPGRPQRRSRL